MTSVAALARLREAFLAERDRLRATLFALGGRPPRAPWLTDAEGRYADAAAYDPSPEGGAP